MKSKPLATQDAGINPGSCNQRSYAEAQITIKHMAIAAKTRRWFRFRLRSLLLAITAVAVPLAWVANERRQSAHEAWIARELQLQGFQDVVLAGPYDTNQLRIQRKPQGLWRDFARRLLGERIIGIHHDDRSRSSSRRGQVLPGKYNFSEWVDVGPDLDPDCNLELLADLTCLQYLTLQNVEVRDLAPLVDLKTLKSLTLMGARVTDLRPLAGLTRLKSIKLDGAQVSDVAPLAQLANLEELSLASTTVMDLSPLVVLTQLRTLHLERTQVEDLTPVARLTNLRELTLSSTLVRDLTPLAKLTNLTILHLEETPFEDLQPLAALQNLEELYLGELPMLITEPRSPGTSHDVSITDDARATPPRKDIAALASLKKLKKLWLNRLPVDQEQVKTLQELLQQCGIVYVPLP